jgi:uncharacterized membrane protein YesL
MGEFAVTRNIERVELDASAVLGEAWRLYKRLFTRSVVLGAIVFGVLSLLELLARSGRAGAALGLLSFAFTLAGVALLQGGLVEIVRGLHTDGDDEPAATELIGRASGELGKLVCVSLLTALGVGFGLLLLLVPGVILMTRWAVSVPVAMLEEGNAREALRRSREIVAGNGWNVFQVLFAVGLLTFLVQIPFLLVAGGSGLLGWWLATTIASALTAPYAAHALTVVYYTLVQPGRPVVLPPGQRWHSVWQEQDGDAGASSEPSDRTSDYWAELEARFDEREGRSRS